jgi:HEAT repeat protein
MDKSEDHITIINQFLTSIVKDEQYSEIVVHEAVEALGNLNDENALMLLKAFEGSERECSEMVRETCNLANDNIVWHNQTEHGAKEGLDLTKLKAKTNDPAPPFNYID